MIVALFVLVAHYGVKSSCRSQQTNILVDIQLDNALWGSCNVGVKAIIT